MIWIDVKECPVPVGVPVLAHYWDTIGILSNTVDDEGREHWWDGDGGLFDDENPDVTHWMPLPDPPRKA